MAQVEIRPNGRLLRVTVTGQMTMGDARQGIERLRHLIEQDGYSRILYDVQRLIPSETYDIVEAVREFERSVGGNVEKVAAVVNDYHVLERVTAALGGVGELQVFYDRGSAERWLEH